MKTNKVKFRSEHVDARNFAKTLVLFGTSLKDACEAIRPVAIKEPGDSHGKGRTMTASEWIEFKKEEKENAES